jgi:hypothetical protein
MITNGVNSQGRLGMVANNEYLGLNQSSQLDH